MPNHLVWPLGSQKLDLYVTFGYFTEPAIKVDTIDGRTAALAVMGIDKQDVAYTQKHFMVLGPGGLEEFDFEPLVPDEMLSLEEGPHR